MKKLINLFSSTVFFPKRQKVTSGRLFFRGHLLLAVLLLSVVLMIGGCKHEADDSAGVVLINLGDSYANGVQSGGGNVNQYTQVNSYPQVIADQMKQVIDIPWRNPLVDMNKQRIDDSFIPYNVGVDGATVKSLLTMTTADWDYMNELMKPIPEDLGMPVTQLEAALYVALRHAKKTKKIFTLFIGGNDVLGTVIAGGGSQLTVDAINAFFSDQADGHDLQSIAFNLKLIVKILKSVPNSYVFIANLPSVAGIGGLLNNQDIENLAVYDNPSISAMDEGEYMGLGPFLQGLGGALAANDTVANMTIQGVLAAGGNDAFSLTADEKALIDTRTDEINDVIDDIVDTTDGVYLVDLVSFFDDILAGDVVVDGQTISRSYGGGLFSADGFHPSNTGYALLANEFIKVINDANIITPIPLADIEAIHAADPYQDVDGDGYFAGPSNLAVINPMFIPLLDCDDGDATVPSPFPSLGMTGNCGSVE